MPMKAEKDSRLALVIIILVLFSVASSCRRNHSRTTDEQLRAAEQKEKLKEDLINQNRTLMLEEQDAITSYINRAGIDSIEKTTTGLHIKILEAGKGKKARLLSKVELSYEARLIDGTFCYSSDSTGRLSFVLGQSDEPSGLQEALLKMSEGEKALVIIPSYLAYGITGDGICVPGSTTLLYTIRLERVKD
jgi:FKBP-type peptidyl-prolyl cis-trans isomerase